MSTYNDIYEAWRKICKVTDDLAKKMDELEEEIYHMEKDDPSYDSKCALSAKWSDDWDVLDEMRDAYKDVLDAMECMDEIYGKRFDTLESYGLDW